MVRLDAKFESKTRKLRKGISSKQSIKFNEGGGLSKAVFSELFRTNLRPINDRPLSDQDSPPLTCASKSTVVATVDFRGPLKESNKLRGGDGRPGII